MTDTAARISPHALRRQMLRGPRIASILLLLLILIMLASGAYWAQQAQLDEVTTGMGQIIPSSEVQVVTNLEGGIVSAINVHEGDQVESGQVLMRIDDTSAAAGFQELREAYYGLLASVARLTAEVEGHAPEFPQELREERPDLVSRELELYEARRDELDSSIAILEEQRAQREGDLEELRSRLSGLRRSAALVNEEYNMTAPLLESGAVSRVDVLRLERERADLSTEIRQTEIAIPNAQAAVAESKQRIAEKRTNARSTALGELNQQQVRLAGLMEQMRARQDRVVRTEVRSPVKGIVKAVNFNTVGGVVKPGEDMVEIVPIEDTLLVEPR